MDIKTKYSKGDTVWTPVEKCEEITCPACDEGTLAGKDGVSYHCPNCDGSGKSYGDDYHAPRQFVVGYVRVDVCNGTNILYSDGDWLSANALEKDCYDTEAECQAECDRLNSKPE